MTRVSVPSRLGAAACARQCRRRQQYIRAADCAPPREKSSLCPSSSTVGDGNHIFWSRQSVSKARNNWKPKKDIQDKPQKSRGQAMNSDDNSWKRETTAKRGREKMWQLELWRDYLVSKTQRANTVAGLWERPKRALPIHDKDSPTRQEQGSHTWWKMEYTVQRPTPSASMQSR